MARTTKGTLFKRKGIYYVEYFVKGKRFKKSLDTGQKTEAQKRRQQLLAPVRAGDEVAIRRAMCHALSDAEGSRAALEEEARERLALADAWHAYAADVDRTHPSEITLNDYEARWNKFTTWMTENHPEVLQMEEITADHARAFVKYLEESGLSPNRFNKIVQGCRLVFSVLVPQCAEMVNPFRRIRSRTLDTHSHRDLTEKELKKILSNAEGELELLFAIGTYTGLRLGDVCTLKWAEVDLEHSRISRVPNKTRRLGKNVLIPLHTELKGMLAEIPLDEREVFVLPGMAARYVRDGAGICKEIRVHLRDKCSITTQRSYKNQKNASCEVGFHSLRHSFVSICAKNDVPLPVVQELCGHGSPAIQRAYIHVGADAALKAIEALPYLGKDRAQEAPSASADNALRVKQIREKLANVKSANWGSMLAEIHKLTAPGKSSKEIH